METRFQTGTVISAIGHLGVILWVLVGDWLFAASAPPEPIVMSVSTLTSAEFDALQAASTPTPSEEPAPVRPQARPEPEPAVEPEPAPEPEPVPEPQPEPEPEPDPVVEPPPSDAVQAEEEQAIESESTEIQPAPEAEAIIAPDPAQPETEAETSDTPEPAVSEEVAPEVVEEQPTEETVAEDTGDVTQTEANIEDSAETGMTTSIRPRAKPSRPEPQPEVAEDTPAEEPQESAQLNVQPVDDADTAVAIDALLGEASEEPVTEDTASADTGGQDLPQGPPLTGGEMGNISSAIARKWNLGASSTDAMSSMVVIRVSFSPDGAPTNFELIDQSGPSPTGIQKLYETAQRAVNRAHQDGGLPLPPDKYDTWRVLDLVFDANGMRAR